MSIAVVTVLIADDSTLVRRHLVALLSTLEGIEVVGEAEDVVQTIETVRHLRPQAVVLDIAMPGGAISEGAISRSNGMHALRAIKHEFPETQVIMLTNNANPFYRNTCLRAGASHFFDKSSEFEKVGDVLRGMRS